MYVPQELAMRRMGGMMMMDERSHGKETSRPHGQFHPQLFQSGSRTPPPSSSLPHFRNHISCHTPLFTLQLTSASLRGATHVPRTVGGFLSRAWILDAQATCHTFSRGLAVQSLARGSFRQSCTVANDHTSCLLFISLHQPSTYPIPNTSPSTRYVIQT